MLGGVHSSNWNMPCPASVALRAHPLRTRPEPRLQVCQVVFEPPDRPPSCRQAAEG